MTKKKGILLGSLAVFALVLIYVLYRFNYLPHPKYSNEKFGIETYRSQVDRDGDGVDDQTDILQSVRAYLDTRPKYKSRYYATGYPDDGYGVCTDVVAFGLLGAGYDLMAAENGLAQETKSLTREQRLKLSIVKISHRKQELNSNSN